MIDTNNVIKWFHSRDTGLSSQTMLATALREDGQPVVAALIGNTGFAGWPHTPQDPSDFGRCLRMTELFPGVLDHREAIAALSQKWRMIMGQWDSLAEQYRKDEPTGRSEAVFAALRAINWPVTP